MNPRLKKGIVSALAVLGTVGLACAAKAEVVASTTAAIESGGDAITNLFYTVLPTILTYVTGIIVTLWAIGWIFSRFTRGRR